MSSTISNNNIQAALESSNKVQYDNIYSNSKFLSEKDKYTLRKQFIQIIPSYYNQTQKSTFPLMKNPNKKTQLEEYRKLQSEITSIKSKITELEIAKRTKLSKIESLRLLIRRVANEDCFLHSQWNIINNNISRERRSISNQKKNNNYYQQKLLTNNTIQNNSNDCEMDKGEEEGSEGRAGYPHAINCMDDKDWFINSCNFDFSFMEKCFSYCKSNLLYNEGKEEHWNC